MPPTTRRQSIYSTTSSETAGSPIDLTSSPEPSMGASQQSRKRTLVQTEEREDGPSNDPTRRRPKRVRGGDSQGDQSQSQSHSQSQSSTRAIDEQPAGLSQPSQASQASPSSIRSWTLPPSERETGLQPRARNDVIDLDDVEEVDLTSDGVGNLGAALQKQRADQIAAQKPEEEQNKQLKLSNITCVICMDTPTDLTATSCGHVFCHTCLMEALIAGENRGGPGETKRSQCPVCRKNISRKKTTDIIPLLLKKALSTQPKRKVDAAVS